MKYNKELDKEEDTGVEESERTSENNRCLHDRTTKPTIIKMKMKQKRRREGFLLIGNL